MSNSQVIILNQTNFETQVLKHEGVVVVDFWAPWCGPCRAMGPVIDQLAEDMQGQVTFCKANVDDNQTIASQYSVRSIPTLIIFKNGKVIGQAIGFSEKESLKQKIEGFFKQ